MRLSRISFFLAMILWLSACAPAALPESPTPAAKSAALPGDDPVCFDFTGIWLGSVTDEINETALDEPWGLVLEQDGCRARGLLATNPAGPQLDCRVENNRLVCGFSSGAECQNEVALNLVDSRLTGTLNSCISTKSEVILEKSSERELREMFGRSQPSAFPANPHPEGCWLHSFYVEGFITVFCDKFEDNSNNWPVGGGSGSLALTGISIENGELVLNVSGYTADGEEASVIHFLPPMAYADDFLFQAAGMISSDLPQSAWGLAFEGEYSGSSLSKYIFLLSNSGQYTVLKFEDSNMITLIAPKKSEAVNQESDNTLTIINQGSRYDFYVNGTPVESLELAPLADTGLMLAVSAAGGVDVEFEFDNLLIRSPRSN
jgi:hypothetical protein